MKNRCFLLGGQDLEMVTIKKLLTQYGEKVIDLNLSWGAKLSDYKEYLDSKDTLYGIELEIDMEIPSNFIPIDHHNEQQHLPSSIQQIANILNHQLSREEELVSINDTQYIKGLQKYGATNIEITRIRNEDRLAQGVSKEEENAATLAMKNLKRVHSIVCHYFNYQHFSPLSDQLSLEHEKFVIYNNKITLFYGFDTSILIGNYPRKNIFYGGGNFGFFGIKENFNENQISTILKGIE